MYYYSTIRLILIYRPSEGGRLSRPRHCSRCAARVQSCVSQWFSWKHKLLSLLYSLTLGPLAQQASVLSLDHCDLICVRSRCIRFSLQQLCLPVSQVSNVLCHKFIRHLIFLVLWRLYLEAILWCTSVQLNWTFCFLDWFKYVHATCIAVFI